MKKKAALLLAGLLGVFTFIGCGNNQNTEQNGNQENNNSARRYCTLS